VGPVPVNCVRHRDNWVGSVTRTIARVTPGVAGSSVSARNTDGYPTFDMVNPHDDGISLDTFVDWLADSGHPIRRIEDYDDWFTRFESALRAMPERKRRHSLLPLTHAFRQPATPVHGSAIPSQRFQQAVREAEIGGARETPRLSAARITKYMTDLRQQRSICALSPPAQQAALGERCALRDRPPPGDGTSERASPERRSAWPPVPSRIGTHPSPQHGRRKGLVKGGSRAAVVRSGVASSR
jgi:hypothetical protein